MERRTLVLVFSVFCVAVVLARVRAKSVSSPTLNVDLNNNGTDEDPAPCGPCPDDEDPVCGVNGVTYDNKCVLECMDVEIWRDGPCAKKDCVIPKIRLPVCGKDGVTYINKWHAECNEVEVQFERACEDYE